MSEKRRHLVFSGFYLYAPIWVHLALEYGCDFENLRDDLKPEVWADDDASFNCEPKPIQETTYEFKQIQVFHKIDGSYSLNLHYNALHPMFGDRIHRNKQNDKIERFIEVVETIDITESFRKITDDEWTMGEFVKSLEGRKWYNEGKPYLRFHTQSPSKELIEQLKASVIIRSL